MTHIDKEIYAQEGVSKRLSHLSGWYYGCSALGILCTALYLLFPHVPEVLSALLLLGMVCGLFMLAVTLCYYLFGDSRQPFDKTRGVFLERQSDYYPVAAREQLMEVLQGGSLSALDAVKRTPSADLLVVRYFNPKTNAAYCQLLESRGDHDIPLTSVSRMK